MGHGLRPYVDYQALDSLFTWMTFLRDPLQVFVSTYIHQYTSTKKKHRYLQMDFLSWVRKFKKGNRQVKYLAGKEDLLKAQEVLTSKNMFVGLVEKFDYSIVLMNALLFENKMDIQYERKMVSRDKALKEHVLELCREHEDEIQSLLMLDNQLYQFVNDVVFPKQIEAYGGLAKLELAANKIETGGRWIGVVNDLRYKVKNNLVCKPFHYIQSRF